MGLLGGNASFVEFEVIGDLPEDEGINFVIQRIRTFGFQDIDDTYDEFSIGWVSPLDMFVSNFESEEGGIVAASLRIDERKIPTAVLSKNVAKAYKQAMEERQLPKLSRALKITIKENVRLALMKRAEPIATVVEMVWDTNRKELFFFSTNKKVQALFEDFFKESFGLIIQQKVPYTIADQMQEVDSEELAKVSPCFFS